jgi:hypothetical protein
VVTPPAAAETSPTLGPEPVLDSVDGTAASPSDRPEIVVGAAFAGGFLLALILKRLAR